MKKFISIFMLATLLMLESYANYTNDFEYEKCTYVRAKDADTIVVNINGENKIIRLVEIDAPESVHPIESMNTDIGKEASNYVKSILKYGKELYISKDMTDKDKYGRLLRVVWLEEPINDSREELIKKSLNARLLINGYAKVVVFNDYKYHQIFKEIER